MEALGQSPNSRLSHLFYSGNYNSLLGIYEAERGFGPKSWGFQDLAFVIGALMFVGEFVRARALFGEACQWPQVPLSFLIESRFYLAIGATRQSNYSEGKQYVASNRRLLKQKSGELSRRDLFYLYQGVAFFPFFRGRFHVVKKLAERAYEHSLAAEFLYGQVLALDILAHASCQTGLVTRGLFEFDKAISVAGRIGNGSLLSALQVSKLKYEAQFGGRRQGSIHKLKTAMRDLAVEDTYSRVELALELVRSLVSVGQGSEAWRVLEEVNGLLYRHRNRRQFAIYNLRCAHLMFLRGEVLGAQALVQSSRSNLDEKIDKTILRQLLGLQQKIESGLKIDFERETTLPSFDQMVDRRIVGRQLRPPQIFANRGEDAMGDLLDDLALNSNEALVRILQEGALGACLIFFKCRPGEKLLASGPTKGSLIAIRGPDVIWIEKGVTAPMRKLFEQLNSTHFRSKEFLIEKIWGYSYDPRIHDRLLHATIGKMRKLLGLFGDWIEWSEQGYRLRTDVGFRAQRENVSKVEIDSKELPPDFSLTNYRQVRILKALKGSGAIGVRDYAKMFRISTMTACRDLTSLVKLNKMRRIGRARGTVYVRLEEEIS